MKIVINFFLKFTNREFSTVYKIISMGPGVVIFLLLSPFIIFQISDYLTSFARLDVSRTVEIVITAVAMLIAIPLMSFSLFELWFKGNGTAAPIAPTNTLVTTGPYHWCRNPIELGTNMYILAFGTFFGSLHTGVLCMIFGLFLGTSYIKMIEEKEMLSRFGKAYGEYLKTTPFMGACFGLRNRVKNSNQQ